MTDIPDDVVKTAIAAADAELDYWSQAGRSSEFRAAVRAAGRVFVEWEREQCAISAELFDGGDDSECDKTTLAIATAIRARDE